MKNHLNSQAHITTTESIICGGISGLGTRAVIAPLDLIKIRLQVQPGHFTIKKVVNIMRNVCKHEGIQAFWKGNIPASFLYVTYSACQFGSLRAATDFLKNWDQTSGWSEPSRQFWAGAFSGTVSSTVSYPFDLLRTRGAASTSTTQRLMKVVPEIYKTEGLRGFYHGATTSIIGTVPYMGSFFCIYSAFRDSTLPPWFPDILGASFVASTLSKTLVMPLDTVRKRIQIQKGGNKQFFHTASTIVKTEGFLALYRGLTIAIIKALPSSFFSMFIFELALTTLREF